MRHCLNKQAKPQMNMKSVFYAVLLFKDYYDFLICVGDFKKSKFKLWEHTCV